jgi:hypothetical protein
MTVGTATEVDEQRQNAGDGCSNSMDELHFFDANGKQTRDG